MPCANWVCNETPLLDSSLRVRATTSTMASLMSNRSVRAGTFLIRARIRSTTSLARMPSFTIRATACRVSSRFGGRASSQRNAAWALVTVAAIGWLTSWAIEAVSCPMVVTRLTCASSICASRRASEASTCSVRSRLITSTASTRSEVGRKRRVGYRQVAPANRKGEPPCVTDFLSREAPLVKRLGRLLKVLYSQEVGDVLPDERLRRHTVSPLEGRVHPLIPVIWSDDDYAIG